MKLGWSVGMLVAAACGSGSRTATTGEGTTGVLALTGSTTAASASSSGASTTAAQLGTSTGTTSAFASTAATTTAGATGGGAPTTVRIACGQTAPITDSSGQVWAADTDYGGGTPGLNASQAVSGTPDPTLYDGQRYGHNGSGADASFSYSIPVGPGAYTLTLDFTESYVTAAGQREFNVTIDGDQVLTNFDIFAAAGGEWVAVQKTFAVTVTGTGGIDIVFGVGSANVPKVDAIAVVPGTPPTSDATTGGTGGSTTGGTATGTTGGVATSGGSTTGSSTTGPSTTTGGNGSTTGVPTGQFSISNGQIIGPTGQPFVARGIDLAPEVDVSQVTAFFPGINFVRVPIDVFNDGFPSVVSQQQLIEGFTDAGIVVEIEDHPWPQVDAYTGSDLTEETSWYASFASAFANNPYVWFGTMNEPQNGYGSAEVDVSAQQLATYQAIRGGGSNAILMMESGVGGGDPGSIGAGFGFVASDYAAMTNVVWDMHFYAWVTNNSTDQGAVTAAFLGSASSGSGTLADATITSADGAIPVIIGEYGPSVPQPSNDPTDNWAELFSTVATSGLGCAAWAWDPAGDSDPVQNLVNDEGSMTVYGQEIADFIQTGQAQTQE